MMYALLLALFLPLMVLFSSAERQQQEMDHAQLQDIVYSVDHLRIALSAYRVTNPPDDNTELVSFEKLRPLLPEMLKERTVGPVAEYYVNKKGFYIVWKIPPPGLAHALVERYTQAVDQSNLTKGAQPWQMAFYHIGFAKEGKLETTRRYQQTAGQQQWILPAEIEEGSLVFTDGS